MDTRAYIRTLKFGVQDFEKTSAKYLNYKTEKRKELDIPIDPCQLVDDGICQLLGYNHYGRDLFERANTKSLIRQCKTMVNGYVYKAIVNYINWYTDESLNDNEVKCFATRAYLENYETFNNEMLEQLEVSICGTE